MWPKCAFGDQKGLIRNIKTCRLAMPLINEQKIAGFEKIDFSYFLPFMDQKVVFWVKKRCFVLFCFVCLATLGVPVVA